MPCKALQLDLPPAHPSDSRWYVLGDMANISPTCRCRAEEEIHKAEAHSDAAK